jgi:S1-C subfamily serine protease
MPRRTICSLFCALSSVLFSSMADAAGPFGSIHVGGWSGGAYTKDADGTFSHCVVSGAYKSGISVFISRGLTGWLLGFANPAWKVARGEAFQVDVTFDSQSQFHFFATAPSDGFVTMTLPPAGLEQLRKAHLMEAFGKGQVFQFELSNTGQLIPTIANCFAKSKAEGVTNAGDFTVPIVKPTAVTSPKVGTTTSGSPTSTSSIGKSAKLTESTGTGIVISTSGHVVTNHHVIDGCVSEIKGKLLDGTPVALRTVSDDETNDLALLQTPTPVRDSAAIRGNAIRSGDAVIAIGYPFHGLLTSDFTVTTGIVSSLSGIFNDTRRLQISAPVQPGNSGGPLLDTSGNVIGVVTSKLNGLKFARLTGDLPENMNFAIKTGALRDFLDNSVVPYKVAEPSGELKTTDVASKARGYTMLISCRANVKE